MKYLVGFYQHEIPGWLLPKLDGWMIIANMRYLGCYKRQGIPGWLLST